MRTSSCEPGGGAVHSSGGATEASSQAVKLGSSSPPCSNAGLFNENPDFPNVRSEPVRAITRPPVGWSPPIALSSHAAPLMQNSFDSSDPCGRPVTMKPCLEGKYARFLPEIPHIRSRSPSKRTTILPSSAVFGTTVGSRESQWRHPDRTLLRYGIMPPSPRSRIHDHCSHTSVRHARRLARCLRRRRRQRSHPAEHRRRQHPGDLERRNDQRHLLARQSPAIRA